MSRSFIRPHYHHPPYRTLSMASGAVAPPSEREINHPISFLQVLNKIDIQAGSSRADANMVTLVTNPSLPPAGMGHHVRRDRMTYTTDRNGHMW